MTRDKICSTKWMLPRKVVTEVSERHVTKAMTRRLGADTKLLLAFNIVMFCARLYFREVNGNMLTLHWRDFPWQPDVVQHRSKRPSISHAFGMLHGSIGCNITAQLSNRWCVTRVKRLALAQ